MRSDSEAGRIDTDGASGPRATRVTASREDQRIACFVALAVAIHAVEASLPSPLPGMKPGLANIITIAVVVAYGLRAAIWVSALRVLAGSLLIGSFLSPTFWLSAAGAAGALAGLAVATRLPAAGAMGASVLAAQGHMLAQFMVAWLWFVPHPNLPALLPPLLTAALVFGCANGAIAAIMLREMDVHSPGRATP